MFRSACLSFRQSMSWIFTLRSEHSPFGVNIHRINHPAISPCRIPTWKPIRMHFSSKSYVYAVIFRKTALCGMITYSYKIHISPHRLTTGPEQNHKIIVKEVPLSESTCSFTPRDFPHRKEAIFMYYSDIDEDDLDGLPSYGCGYLMRSYQYHLQSTPVRENDRLSDGRCLAHSQKRPAGIFTAGREFGFLSKKLYAVLIPAYSFSFVWFYTSTLPSL